MRLRISHKDLTDSNVNQTRAQNQEDIKITRALVDYFANNTQSPATKAAKSKDRTSVTIKDFFLLGCEKLVAGMTSSGNDMTVASENKVRVTIQEPDQGKSEGKDDSGWDKRSHRMNSIRKRGYEIVSVTERHGPMRKAIPLMPMPMAGLCCLINCVLPGIGTILSGFTALCGCRTEHESRCVAFLWNLLTGLLQLVTTPLLLVGWIWSIIWGVTFLQLIFDDAGSKAGKRQPRQGGPTGGEQLAMDNQT